MYTLQENYAHATYPRYGDKITTERVRGGHQKQTAELEATDITQFKFKFKISHRPRYHCVTALAVVISHEHQLPGSSLTGYR